MKRIRVILLDTRELYREGTTYLLNTTKSIEVVGTCFTTADTIEKVNKLKPDIIIVCTKVPIKNCIEAVRRICEVTKEARVLMLSHSREGDDFIDAIRAGVKGYISDTTSIENLIKSIEIVAVGGTVIGNPMSEIMLREFNVLEDSEFHQKYTDTLSHREREVVNLLSKGHTNKEIAEALFITENTVKVHMHRIINKLNVNNRQQVLIVAMAESKKLFDIRGKKPVGRHKVVNSLSDNSSNNPRSN